MSWIMRVSIRQFDIDTSGTRMSHIVLDLLPVIIGFYTALVLFEKSKCVDTITMSYTVTDPISLFLMNI